MRKRPETIRRHPRATGAGRRIAPLMAVLLVAFLAVGFMLPALPLHVHNDLGLGSGWLGVVAGSHFIAAIATRPLAGRMADRRGGKPVVGIGLGLAMVGGAVTALSLLLVSMPVLSALVLTAGRTVLGAAESLLITGAVGWGIALVPPEERAFAISWLGSAMFLAFAVAMPLGSLLYHLGGLGAVALTTVALPLPMLAVLRRLANNPLRRDGPVPARVVARAVLAPGLALGLASLGYGVVLVFTVLLFELRGWAFGWLAVTCFSLAFVLLRLLCGTVPDRYGGGRVAAVSLVMQAGGLCVIGFSSHPALALVGATLAGLGYAFVFPGLGIEALRRVPAGAGGTAMAFYTAFLDIALGVGIPVLGLAAESVGLPAVFFAAAAASMAAVLLCLRLARWQPAGQSKWS